jgi:hypothetical protein
LERIGFEILHFDLALEGDAEDPDARCSKVSIKKDIRLELKSLDVES